MINIKTFFLFLCMTFLFSCHSIQQYYLYYVESDDDVVMHNGFMSSANDHIIIYYDFFGEGGNSKLTIKNKNDYEVIVDVPRTQLIVNNFSRSYFNDLVFVCIPPQSRKEFVNGYNIVGHIPHTHVNEVFNFLRTPLEFKFYITYFIGETPYKHIDQFYVDRVYFYDRSTDKMTKRVEREPNKFWLRR